MPNHGSWQSRLLRDHFGHGITDEQLWHFSTRTLRRLVERTGFRVQSVATWSYRQDPRLLWDLCGRFGKRAWLERKAAVPPGQSMDVPTGG